MIKRKAETEKDINVSAKEKSENSESEGGSYNCDLPVIPSREGGWGSSGTPCGTLGWSRLRLSLYRWTAHLSISIFYILINTKGNGNPSMTNGSHCCGTWFLMCLFQGNMFSGNNVSDLLWCVQSFYLMIFVCGYIVKHYLSCMDWQDMITHFV